MPHAKNKFQKETIAVNFTYASASPLTLINIPANTWVDKAEITITDEFDDVAATLKIGTVANDNLLLDTFENDPLVKGDYSNDENILIALAEILRLTINPAASTKGAGTVFLTIRR
jgi:hypothetical protein